MFRFRHHTATPLLFKRDSCYTENFFTTFFLYPHGGAWKAFPTSFSGDVNIHIKASKLGFFFVVVFFFTRFASIVLVAARTSRTFLSMSEPQLLDEPKRNKPYDINTFMDLFRARRRVSRSG